MISGSVDGVWGDGELIMTAYDDDEIDPEKQMDSWMWRCALLGFLPRPEVVHVETYCIEFRRDDNLPSNVLVVKDFRQLTHYKYPALMEDVRAKADEFAFFAGATGWRGEMTTPTPRKLIVSKVDETLEWLKGIPAVPRVRATPVPRAVDRQLEPGDIVVGSLPLVVAAQVCQRGAEYWHINFRRPRHTHRDLTAAELGKTATVERYIITAKERIA